MNDSNADPRATNKIVHYQQMLEALLISPIAIRENRARMRGWRAPVLLAVAVGLAIILCLFTMFITRPGSPFLRFFNADFIYFVFGRISPYTLYLLMMSALIMLVFSLLMAALISGTYAAEQKTQTLEALWLTGLTDEALFVGKVISSISFILIVLFCILPVLTVFAVIQGIALIDLARVILLILLMVISLGLMGVALTVQKGSAAGIIVLSLCYLCFVVPLLTRFGIFSILLLIHKPVWFFSTLLISGIMPYIIMHSKFVMKYIRARNIIRKPEQVVRNYFTLFFISYLIVNWCCVSYGLFNSIVQVPLMFSFTSFTIPYLLIETQHPLHLYTMIGYLFALFLICYFSSVLAVNMLGKLRMPTHRDVAGSQPTP